MIIDNAAFNFFSFFTEKINKKINSGKVITRVDRCINYESFDIFIIFIMYTDHLGWFI